MNKKFTTSQITLLGLMIAILLLMAYTPLGYLNIGPLAITFNIIPVAISAITMGPVGGAIAGAVFGLTSFGQCMRHWRYQHYGCYLIRNQSISGICTEIYPKTG